MENQRCEFRFPQRLQRTKASRLLWFNKHFGTMRSISLVSKETISERLGRTLKKTAGVGAGLRTRQHYWRRGKSLWHRFFPPTLHANVEVTTDGLNGTMILVRVEICATAAFGRGSWGFFPFLWCYNSSRHQALVMLRRFSFFACSSSV